VKSAISQIADTADKERLTTIKEIKTQVAMANTLSAQLMTWKKS
jgi:hypothetical protein